MTNILDLVENERASSFRPSIPDDFFALRLAQRLGEPATASHYATLVSEHSRDTLLKAYKRALSDCPDENQRGRHMQELLAIHPELAAHYPNPRLLSLAVMRRAVGAAVFVGTHLDSVRIRHLPSHPAKAEFSAAAFIGTAISESRSNSAAIETLSGQDAVVRTTLHKVAVEQLRASAISIWDTGKQSVTHAFAYPPPRTRKEVRRIVAAVWPLPNGLPPEPVVLDALALGLFVQTERLFAADD